MRVLIVDDDAVLRGGIAELLQRNDLSASEADTADLADTLVRTQEFAAIVLDLGLPDQDGLDLLRQWRARGLRTPVIVVSARGAPDDRADGILAGADDYLGKPYHARELLARIRRQLHGAQPHKRCLNFGANGEFEYDSETREISGPDGPIALSGTLRRVLVALIGARQRPLSKHALLDQVSQIDDPATLNAVEQWIRRLRGRLGTETILTEPDLGYRLRWPDRQG